MIAESLSDTKFKLIESARDLYLEEGLGEVTMRKVAKKAGLSTMATYRHFENKDDLLGHVVGQGFRIFQTYFNRALKGKTAADRLRLCADYYLQFALENPKYYEVMFMSLVQLRELEFQENGKQQVKAALKFLVDRVEDCKSAGPMVDLPAKSIALHLWSHSHGLVSLHLSGRFDVHRNFKKFYGESMMLVLAGLGI